MLMFRQNQDDGQIHGSESSGLQQARVGNPSLHSAIARFIGQRRMNEMVSLAINDNGPSMTTTAHPDKLSLPITAPGSTREINTPSSAEASTPPPELSSTMEINDRVSDVASTELNADEEGPWTSFSDFISEQNKLFAREVENATTVIAEEVKLALRESLEMPDLRINIFDVKEDMLELLNTTYQKEMSSLTEAFATCLRLRSFS